MSRFTSDKSFLRPLMHFNLFWDKFKVTKLPSSKCQSLQSAIRLIDKFNACKWGSSAKFLILRRRFCSKLNIRICGTVRILSSIWVSRLLVKSSSVILCHVRFVVIDVLISDEDELFPLGDERFSSDTSSVEGTSMEVSLWTSSHSSTWFMEVIVVLWTHIFCREGFSNAMSMIFSEGIANIFKQLRFRNAFRLNFNFLGIILLRPMGTSTAL